MRGADEQTASLFSYVSCEARIPSSHPLRRVQAVVDEALDVLSLEFDGIYAQDHRRPAATRSGEKRSNETHASTTDPDARLARKSSGQSSIMAHAGHVLMENRNGLVSQVCLT